MKQGEGFGAMRTREVKIPSGDLLLEGELSVPEGATGIVLFAHGSGSSRFSPRNRFVARMLRERRIATLLFDLLTRDEEAFDLKTAALRFDTGLLAKRLVDATRWLDRLDDVYGLRVGYFGASTGGGAALVAAAELGDEIGAVVSRGGRPDLAGEETLRRVKSPTLLIVGEHDPVVLKLNEEAFRHLQCEKELVVVPGATHLFEEPGALEEVARLAGDWFARHLGRA
ncbi:dienelactone hydrolase family protein [Pyrinomonas sp.]|uniref:dienelactone hydrolase family protein n=1 Tax=Pyrinomonas sp. TaxID=2080306 RepID=UPI003331CD6E